VLVYCRNAAHCHHNAEMNVDDWPDDTPFAVIAQRMVCTRCGIVGADVRPDWRPQTQHRK
jgi:hypothetical protein